MICSCWDENAITKCNDKMQVSRKQKRRQTSVLRPKNVLLKALEERTPNLKFNHSD